MIGNQWHQRGMAIILKKVCSLKMRRSKVMASFTYCDNINGPTAYLRRQLLLRMLKRLTSKLSSTRNMI